MGPEKRKDVKCAWCGEVIPISEIEVKHQKNDYGNVVERRCPKCNKVLAAYAEDQGDFLSSMRTF
ncbi:hypothetical protein ACFLVI_01175 [Chloroflexota bacterium]